MLSLNETSFSTAGKVVVVGVVVVDADSVEEEVLELVELLEDEREEEGEEGALTVVLFPSTLDLLESEEGEEGALKLELDKGEEGVRGLEDSLLLSTLAGDVIIFAED